MCGYVTKEENEKEIKAIIDYFNGISEYFYFDFEFLDYFVDSDEEDIKIDNNNKIEMIKKKLY